MAANLPRSTTFMKHVSFTTRVEISRVVVSISAIFLREVVKKISLKVVSKEFELSAYKNV